MHRLGRATLSNEKTSLVGCRGLSFNIAVISLNIAGYMDEIRKYCIGQLEQEFVHFQDGHVLGPFAWIGGRDSIVYEENLL